MRGSALGPHSLLLGPFPGEPGFAPREIGENLPLPSSSLTLGTLSNCTKVAVVPVLPPHQGGVCFQSFLSHGLHSRPRQSPAKNLLACDFAYTQFTEFLKYLPLGKWRDIINSTSAREVFWSCFPLCR